MRRGERGREGGGDCVLAEITASGCREWGVGRMVFGGFGCFAVGRWVEEGMNEIEGRAANGLPAPNYASTL